MTESKLEAAVALAGRGFRVFPLEENGKTPVLEGWPDKATTDPNQIRRWWRCHVTSWEQPYNIGVATGDGLIVLDVDTKNGAKGDESLDTLAMLYDDLPDTYTVETPTGGRHLYLGTTSTERVANSAAKLGPGHDIRGHHGYVVGPGSTIDGRAYTVTNDRLGPAAAPDWLLGLCGKPREAEPPRDLAPAATLDTPEAVSRAIHYLTHEAPEAIEGAAGDATTYQVAARVKDHGVSETTALDLMLDHWNEQQSPPWAPEDLQTKVHNAYRYGKEPPGSHDPRASFAPLLDPPSTDLTPQPVHRFEPESLPPRKWLIGNLALAGKVTVVVAPPGAGKSTLTLGIAVSLASGQPILGLPVHRRGRVAVYNNEDDLEEMRRRLAALLQHNHLDWTQLEDARGPRLYMNSGETRALTIAHRVGPDGRIKPADAESMIAHIRKYEIETLIVDPFAETHQANENSNEEILAVGRIYRQIAQATGAAVILVHHTRKAPAASSEGHAGNMDSARGAGSLAGVARVMVTLYAMSEQDGRTYGVPADDRHRFVRLDDAKANLSLGAGRPRWLRRVSVDLPVRPPEGEGGSSGEADASDAPGGMVEPVGVLEPAELLRTREDESTAQRLARDLAAAFGESEREASLRELIRRLIDHDPMHQGKKEDTLQRKILSELDNVATWTPSGWLLVKRPEGKGARRRVGLFKSRPSEADMPKPPSEADSQTEKSQ